MFRSATLCLALACFVTFPSCEPKAAAVEVPKADPTVMAEMDAAGLQAIGFKPLFENDSLDGFVQRMGTEASFTLKDGELYGTAKDMKRNSFLCTKKDYGDFIIAFEFKFDHLEGNSGMMFRGLYREAGDTVYGYQCEHDNTDRSWTAGLYDEKRRHWIYPEKETDLAKAFTQQGQEIFKKDGWNLVVIRCIGNKIDSWLNGQHRIDYIDTHPEHSTPRGFFGFQVHNGKRCDVRWRNVLIKEIKN